MTSTGQCSSQIPQRLHFSRSMTGGITLPFYPIVIIYIFSNIQETFFKAYSKKPSSESLDPSPLCDYPIFFGDYQNNRLFCLLWLKKVKITGGYTKTGLRAKIGNCLTHVKKPGCPVLRTERTLVICMRLNGHMCVKADNMKFKMASSLTKGY